MKFTTETGSQYEIDLEIRKIRRLGNEKNKSPTNRQGTDGEWKQYTYVHPAPTIGRELLVCWDIVKEDPTLDGQDRHRTTMTSKIVKIEGEDDL